MFWMFFDQWRRFQRGLEAKDRVNVKPGSGSDRLGSAYEQSWRLMFATSALSTVVECVKFRFCFVSFFVKM